MVWRQKLALCPGATDDSVNVDWESSRARILLNHVPITCCRSISVSKPFLLAAFYDAVFYCVFHQYSKDGRSPPLSFAYIIYILLVVSFCARFYDFVTWVNNISAQFYTHSSIPMCEKWFSHQISFKYPVMPRPGKQFPIIPRRDSILHRKTFSLRLSFIFTVCFCI